MAMSHHLIRALCVVFCCTAPALGQSPFDSIATASGKCRKWAIPPGGSNASDWGLSDCAVDTPVRWIATNPVPPTPRFKPFVRADLFIMVDSTGTPDPQFVVYRGLGAHTWGLDQEFYDSVMTLAKTWRFQPAMLNGRPVRSSIDLVIGTPFPDQIGSDTLRQSVTWTHRHGVRVDSIVGTWVTQPSLPDLDQRTSRLLYSLTVEQLHRAGALQPFESYCPIVPDSSFMPLLREITALSLSSPACLAEPGHQRIKLSRIFVHDIDRVVVLASGDYLKAWPPSSREKHDWPGWAARCVVVKKGNEWIPDCEVRPLPSGPGRRMH